MKPNECSGHVTLSWYELRLGVTFGLADLPGSKARWVALLAGTQGIHRFDGQGLVGFRVSRYLLNPST
jgi:hypothetical protein